MKDQSSDDILYLDQWLLQRRKSIIHYGGTGATSAGLYAGIPNIVIPFTQIDHFGEDESTT